MNDQFTFSEVLGNKADKMTPHPRKPQWAKYYINGNVTSSTYDVTDLQYYDFSVVLHIKGVDDTKQC